MLTKDKDIVQEFDKAIGYEWLETNGLGGWSGSTIIGANTRRYHGLLVAATVPPVERTVLLSKLDETIVIDGHRYELGCNNYPSGVIHPKGHQYLSFFSKDIVPSWLYEAGGIQFKKSVILLHGENTVIVSYEVLK